MADRNEDQPRRSGRAKTSTTIQIDGHTVLRQNNYRVVGLKYVYDLTGDDETVEEYAKPPAAKKSKTTASRDSPTSVITKQPRAVSEAEVARLTHNECIAAVTKAKLPLQRAFLARHVAKLEPFCDENVLEKLVKEAEQDGRKLPAKNPKVPTNDDVDSKPPVKKDAPVRTGRPVRACSPGRVTRARPR